MKRLNPIKEVLLIGTTILIASVGVAAKILTIPKDTLSPAGKQATLQVQVSHPYLLEGINQKAYIRVALDGFELEPKSTRTPVNVSLVIDRSGSMSGDRLQNAKKAAITAVEHLNSNDIVSVVVYDDEATVVVPATKVTDKSKIIRQVEQIQIGGSTALFAGVSKGAQELRKFIDKNRVNRVILLSDGQANVGPSSPSELGNLGASLAKEGISVTTIGLGLGFNEDLMTELALKSDGNHAFVKDPEELVALFDREFGDVLSVVAQNVTVTIQCAEGVKPLRVLGREAQIYGNKVIASLRQLYSKQEKYFMVEVEIPGSLKGNDLALASVSASYDNMVTHQKDALAARPSISFTKDKALATSRMNKTVMADAVEQISVENNKQAIQLRDRGDIEGAKKALTENASFVRKGATEYAAPKLEQRAKEIDNITPNLGSSKWGEARKTINQADYKSKTQQSY